MSNLVAFLESLGTDGRLHGLSPEDYAAAVAQLDVEPALREALIARDSDAITRLVRQSPMMMVLFPVEPDSVPADDDGKGGGNDDTDADEREGGDKKSTP